MYIRKSHDKLNDLEINYKYNEDGIRVEKSVKDIITNKIITTSYNFLVQK